MTIPDTVSLDIPCRGGPALGLVQIASATPALGTCNLDMPACGLPYLWLYPKTYPQALTGTLAASATVANIKGKAALLTASIALSGATGRQTSKTFSGGISVSGGPANRPGRVFASTIIMHGVLLRQPHKQLSVTFALHPVFSGPNGAEAIAKIEAAVLANRGTMILAILPYTTPE